MINKLILPALLSITLAFSFTSANAALITQDIISESEGIIGSITINTSSAESGDYGLSDVLVWEEFSLFGWDMQALTLPDANQFIASFNTDDLFSGIQDLYFDLNDDFAAYPYSYNGSVGDIFNPGATGFIDIFDDVANPAQLVEFYSDVYFGEATVVPTPATLILFLTAVVGLVVRRKNS